MFVACSTHLAAQSPRRIEYWQEPQQPTRTLQPGVAFLTSALLPGAGQAYLRVGRWAPYAALEAWAWVSYVSQKSHGRTLERDYREIAWNVARRISVGPRRDSIFPYYEAMSETLESGAFDADPVAVGVQPEDDAITFNGQQWERAKALYMPGGNALPGSAEYERALRYYLSTAIPPSYAWSWADNRLELQQFRRTIEDSDHAFRSATRTLGLILANHMVSAIDALVTARLKGAAGTHNLEIGSRLEPVNGSMTWTSTVRLTVGK